MKHKRKANTPLPNTEGIILTRTFKALRCTQKSAFVPNSITTAMSSIHTRYLSRAMRVRASESLSVERESVLMVAEAIDRVRREFVCVEADSIACLSCMLSQLLLID